MPCATRHLALPGSSAHTRKDTTMATSLASGIAATLAALAITVNGSGVPAELYALACRVTGGYEPTSAQADALIDYVESRY